MCCGVGVGHTDSVGSICVSQRDSTYASKLAVIVTGGVDKVIKRWSIPYDKIQSLSSTKNTPPISLNCTHSVRGHDKDINTLAMSPNDAIVASGSQDSTIRIWNSNDLSSVATLSGHKKGIWRVCFSPVDRCLASCSGDRTVRLWSLNDYSCLRTFQGHTASVLAVKFINHGMQLVSSSSDGLIRLWTIRTGECENTFDKHKDKIWSLSLSKTDSNVFYSAGSDSCIIKWMDDTDQIEEDRLKSAERVLLLEQSLSNSIRNKKYNEVINTFIDVLCVFVCICICLCDYHGVKFMHYHSLDSKLQLRFCSVRNKIMSANCDYRSFSYELSSYEAFIHCIA
jgi:U3 small nucleolar RNA-associated protein 13